MFDWKQLKRWNLSVDAVPPGSRIINREYTLWERNRTAVIVTAFVLVMQTLLIAALMVSRVQRQRTERQLAEQVRFLALLAELSARFVRVPADQVEEEIREIQHRICEALDLDRSALWQRLGNEPGGLYLTHIHTPAGATPTPDRMDAREHFPWLLQRVMRDETTIIPRLAALPPEAARDRETLQAYGTRSTVVVPLSSEGNVFGAISFAMTRREREWPDDVVRGFRIVAEVIANALARSQADRALRESRARLTLAAAGVGARLWEVEQGTDRIWMTEEGRASFGLATDEEPTVDRLADFVHPDDRDAWRRGIREALESDQPLYTEFRVMPPDGDVRWIVSRGRIHAGVAGAPKRLLGVSIDITERKRIEGEFDRLRGELAHVGRVTTVGGMTTAIAHELNQPLTAIMSNAHAGERFLAEREPPLDEIREILRDVMEDARRAGDVIQRLRSLLRKEEPRRIPLDLNVTVRELMALTRSDTLLRNVAIELDLEADLPPVRGDRVQLQQVVLNLVLNGLEAMGQQAEGGRMRVRTARTHEAVCVSVQDNGTGIPDGILSRVFEPFRTTKPAGLGMGLAISRSIVETHRGRIWAENNPDRGATFHFSLPICPPGPGADKD
jgi:PAS domain S-box-containing protein